MAHLCGQPRLRMWGDLDLAGNLLSAGVTADRILFEDPYEGQVPVLLVVVEPVAHHKLIGNLKADIIRHCGCLDL